MVLGATMQVDKGLIREIGRLSIPNILSNITAPLLGLVDTALMGNYGSAKDIGAMALGTTLFNLVYWVFGFLRMGTSGFTAQAFGRKDKKAISEILFLGLSMALCLSFCLLALQLPIIELGLFFFDGSAEVEHITRNYFTIRVWALPAGLLLFVFVGWFLGMQNSHAVMWIVISANLTNILFSAWFVIGLDLGVVGVAWGTVVAQYLALALAVLLFRYHYSPFALWLRHSYSLLIRFRSYKRLLTVNRDTFLRSLLITFFFTWFTFQSAAQGDTLLAVNTLLLNFLFFYIFVVDGLAAAGEALTGKYIGAKNTTKLHQMIAHLFGLGSLITWLFVVGYFLIGEQIISWLTIDPILRQESIRFLWWAILIPAFSLWGFILDGIYIGATAFKQMLTSALGSVLLSCTIFYLLSDWGGNHLLWFSITLFFLSRGIISALLYRKTFSQMKTG